MRRSTALGRSTVSRTTAPASAPSDPPLARVRQRAGDQLEEQHPEGVDVGRRGDRLAQDLLRRRVGGGEHAGVELGELGVLSSSSSPASSLAMPKSSSLTVPSAATRMLAGLRSRCTTRRRWALSTAAQTSLHQPQPGLEAELPRFAAVVGDRHPLHPLQHEEGAAVGGAAAVEQAGDAGVVEAGEDLALAHEALHDRRESIPRLISLSAARWVKLPSSRSAR